uniref:ShKT domain-containing protein n=1 Tax=Meloidogyne floridensis TaxID=298350 RepID=A0A915PEW9_9BILA
MGMLVNCQLFPPFPFFPSICSFLPPLREFCKQACDQCKDQVGCIGQTEMCTPIRFFCPVLGCSCSL